MNPRENLGKKREIFQKINNLKFIMANKNLSKQEFQVVGTYKGEVSFNGQRHQFEKRGGTFEEYELIAHSLAETQTEYPAVSFILEFEKEGEVPKR